MVTCFDLGNSENSLAFPHLFCAERGTIHSTDKPCGFRLGIIETLILPRRLELYCPNNELFRYNPPIIILAFTLQNTYLLHCREVTFDLTDLIQSLVSELVFMIIHGHYMGIICEKRKPKPFIFNMNFHLTSMNDHLFL